jgi:N-acetylneuraminate synthase
MNGRTFIIAEAGVNHNGSVKLARDLIDVAREAGADAVKFQSFRAASLVTRHASKAAYQVANTGAPGSQLEMLRSLELSDREQRSLLAHARKRRIQFLSSPFDLDSLQFLVKDLRLPALKIPSGEATNAPLLLAAARSGRRLIVSTGMCTLADIETTLGVIAFGMRSARARPSAAAFAAAFADTRLRSRLQERVTLLHCTTDYPTRPEDVNLAAMQTMHQAFGLPVGYSDHSEGVEVSIAAVARGACVIEKHFTLDRSMPGPDHRASLSPEDLGVMVRGIRTVERCIGTGVRRPTPAELDNRVTVRRSIVAATPIAKGERFTEGNLAVKRPAGGVSPLLFWDVVGRRATRDYAADEAIEL